MFRLVFPARFKRNLRDFLKKHPELRDALHEKLALIQRNPMDVRLRTHKLTGKFKDCFAAWITYEYRFVFSLDGDSVFLLAIGTHDEVY
ncbi:MAG: type II toxin-antitoxin system mRNA interferase toxin, RelE/StbE family [Candidatus Brennerbacteria bacterium]